MRNKVLVSKRSMTLIEVMIAMSLFILATSAIGWKMHEMLAKKRFTSNVERLKSRLLTCHRLALNMQADWIAEIECKDKQTFLTMRCVDHPSLAEHPSLKLDLLEFQLNGEGKAKFSFDFTASGDILPVGCLQILRNHLVSVTWDLPGLFSLSDGDCLGPLHPDDVK